MMSLMIEVRTDDEPPPCRISKNVLLDRPVEIAGIERSDKADLVSTNSEELTKMSVPFLCICIARLNFTPGPLYSLQHIE